LNHSSCDVALARRNKLWPPSSVMALLALLRPRLGISCPDSPVAAVTGKISRLEQAERDAWSKHPRYHIR
jgi:hypothetical protein